MTGKLNKIAAVSLKSLIVGKKLADGGGMYLLPDTPASGTWWLKYRDAAGKETRCSFGRYPAVSLADARRAREEAKLNIQRGIYPNGARREKREAAKRVAGASFPAVAEAWLAEREKDVKAKRLVESTYKKQKAIVSDYLIPPLRKESVATLTSRTAIRILKALAERVPSSGKKARQYLGQIILYAQHEGLRDEEKPMIFPRGFMQKEAREHVPAATDTKAAAAVIKAIAGYESEPTRHALTIALLTAQRPGNIVTMRWADVDLEAATWSIPAEVMKMRRAHVVPLPEQAVEVLRAMLKFSEGREYVFPALSAYKSPHMHRDTLSRALGGMGFRGKHSTHGFRAMFRTLARERLKVDKDVLEAQLAHAKKGEVEAAYDRAWFDDERKDAMQRWADYVDTLRQSKDGGNVVAIKQRAA